MLATSGICWTSKADSLHKPILKELHTFNCVKNIHSFTRGNFWRSSILHGLTSFSGEIKMHRKLPNSFSVYVIYAVN